MNINIEAKQDFVEASILNSKNKINIEYLTSFKHIFFNGVLPWFSLFGIWGGIPYGAYLLDRANRVGVFFPLSLVFLYLLGGLVLLMFVNVVYTISSLIAKLLLDVKKGLKFYDKKEGRVKSKLGMKTWGAEIDEYSIVFEDSETRYYIDRKLYSIVATGDYIKIEYLPKSKVVLRYRLQQ